MGFERIAGTDAQYALISFDTDGNERPEQSGRMSDVVIQKAVADAATDIFFFCHGWNGDVPAAINQYGKWIGALVRSEDRRKAEQTLSGFRPLLVGLHWPSLPWGDEELRSSSFAAVGAMAGRDALIASYLARLGDKPDIRKPLEVIIDEARRNAAPDELPPHVRQAYLDLNDALGLKSEGVDAPPDADRAAFDPQDAFDAAEEAPTSFGGDFDLGGLLGPLRQLSYWTMKKRARTIGEGGMHRFLVQLQQATAAQKTRIHLMGHSFGTIIVSGMVGGPNAQGALPRPVHSLVLVQGAVSLWCYAAQIPFANVGSGYFSRILADRKIRGPLVTTRSKFDFAVGVFYPLASRLKGAASFVGAFPEFGGIGAYGIQGIADSIRSDIEMKASDGAYAFEQGKVYNLDGSQFICNKQGAAGAHADIAGPEVAHTLWSAALASV